MRFWMTLTVTDSVRLISAWLICSRMNSSAMYPHVMAPQANMFCNVPGYEGTVPGGGGFLPPPMPMEPVAPSQPGPENLKWSEDPVTQGVITSMDPFNTFRYRLETFTDSRSTEWAHKPHEGEPADFYTQPAPRPWEVQATHPKLFSDHTEKIRVPYTSSVKWALCRRFRMASSTPTSALYANCSGSWACSSPDATLIRTSGRDMKNHVEDHLVEQSCGLKSDKLHSVKGKELFKNSQNLVHTHKYQNFIQKNYISVVSHTLIKEHQTKYGQTSRILQQRQTVELIPITQVNYKWKDKSYVYYVYGNERKVSADDYPETCCCVIL
ncbi:transmembrane protein [Sarotherodon galilaeus]